jgi:hypothetical protein
MEAFFCGRQRIGASALSINRTFDGTPIWSWRFPFKLDTGTWGG